MSGMDNLTQMAKAELRALMHDLRRQQNTAQVEELSRRIQQRVLQLPIWNAAARICCYLAKSDEVQTDRLMAAARAADKEIWIPAWHAKKRRYECVPLKSSDEMVPGRFDVREPAHPRWMPDGVAQTTVELVLVPGLAFDDCGGRLGHGKGYYDDLLSRPPLRGALKIGLAFAFQIRGQVPMDQHDRCMDLVVTEQKIHECCNEVRGTVEG